MPLEDFPGTHPWRAVFCLTDAVQESCGAALTDCHRGDLQSRSS